MPARDPLRLPSAGHSNLSSVIRSLSGRLSALDADAIVVEVGGVGLYVRVSGTSARAFPALGGQVSLTTHLVVREDALDLYGFATDDERRLFELLIGISGVGPKVALAICSVDSVDGVRLAIARGDSAKIQRANGVGKRTAERVVLELKDRMGDGSATVAVASPVAQQADVFLSARDALISLGFSGDEADGALTDADVALGAEELIRHALSRLRRP